jgi:hypothetical protein
MQKFSSPLVSFRAVSVIAAGALASWAALAEEKNSKEGADACLKIRSIQSTMNRAAVEGTYGGRVTCEEGEFIIRGARQIEAIGRQHPECHVNFANRERGIAQVKILVEGCGLQNL